ncbi:hypothetical protein [Dickeya dadantii]|uniref:hypothetical protein n=1 Tax=Dickeya dadantii TaxID=204038 RepID=UPI002542B077|nr:hypothetical protein [Dickeya dadantii]
MNELIKNIRRLGCVLGLMLLTTCAMADEVAVYQGKLGNAGIVMTLTFSDNGVEGRYFYSQYRKDLPLSVKWDKTGVLVLREGKPQWDEQAQTGKPVMTLRTDNQKNWQGEWRSGKGKTYPVTLSPAALPAALSPFMQTLYQLSPYEYLRQAQTVLAMTKKETVNGHEIEWWQEPVSGMTTFQIASGYSDAQRGRLNAALQTLLWQNVIGYHDCMMVSQYQGEAMSVVDIQLLSPSVLSVSDLRSSICDGGHSSGNWPIRLRVSDGHPLVLSDVLWVGDGPVPDNSTIEKGEYNNTILPAWLVTQLTQYYPEQMRTPVNSDDCDYSNQDIWNGYDNNWILTPKGILFSPSFSDAQQPCAGESWPVIPWDIVKQHPGRLKDLPLP